MGKPTVLHWWMGLARPLGEPTERILNSTIIALSHSATLYQKSHAAPSFLSSQNHLLSVPYMGKQSTLRVPVTSSPSACSQGILFFCLFCAANICCGRISPSACELLSGICLQGPDGDRPWWLPAFLTCDVIFQRGRRGDSSGLFRSEGILINSCLCESVGLKAAGRSKRTSQVLKCLE